MGIMFLVRGRPGSGRTTYAQVNLVSKGYTHIEYEEYFKAKKMSFVYNEANIRAADDWCQRRAKEAVLKGEDVVVSNPFTHIWELGTYLKIAQSRGYVVVVHKCEGEFEPTNPYPPQALKYMRERFEE